MSLFDELRCEYPLPDGFDPTGHVFQTRDTPDQYLSVYLLRADGVLVQQATGEVYRHHGALTFYTGNVCGFGPMGFVTRDDAPPWEAEYTILYDHGTPLKIEGEVRPNTSMHGPQILCAAWRRTYRLNIMGHS